MPPQQNNLRVECAVMTGQLTANGDSNDELRGNVDCTLLQGSCCIVLQSKAITVAEIVPLRLKTNHDNLLTELAWRATMLPRLT